MTNITTFADIRQTLGRRQPEPLRARLYLFGLMRAVSAAGEDLLPPARKSRALLAYISMAGGERVPRSRLATLLWDRSGDAQARMSLRHALSELNGSVNRRVPGLVEIGRDWVRLDMRTCWIDALAVSDQCDQLLEGFDGISVAFDQWLTTERIRYEDGLRSGLESELNRLIEEDAAPDVRAAAARKLVNFEPTNETAVRALMLAFIQMGDRGQALREYERCRAALQASLDIRPSKETVALFEAARVTAQDAGTLAKRYSVQLEAKNDAGAAPIKSTQNISSAERSDRPSIAVLPFENLSVDPEHEYAADGLVEDLTEALSRVPTFFVVSRLSAKALKGQYRSAQEIGDALGVRYILSGSMRILGDRLRLTAELTDTSAGIALWSSKLDERFFDLFEVQNRLAGAIVGRVAPYLHAAEIKRAQAKRPEHLNVFDLFLRAQEKMHNSSRTVFELSEDLFDQALARQPHHAPTLAWRAYWHVLRVGQGWSPDPASDTEQAEKFARRAVDCDVLEPMAFAVQGHIASYLHKDFSFAFNRFETALRINPNAAPAWLWSAAAHAWMGEGALAVEEVNRAMALSPYDPLMYAFSGVAGVAYLVDQQYERAIECGLRCMRENRTYTTAYKLLTIALVLAGRKSKAQGPVRQLIALDPLFTVKRFRDTYPGIGSACGESFCDALFQAGVPLG